MSEGIKISIGPIHPDFGTILHYQKLTTRNCMIGHLLAIRAYQLVIIAINVNVIGIHVH